MQYRRISSALAVLSLALLVLAGCGEEEPAIPTPALNLATPTASGNEAALPTQIVVVIVTPTPGEEEAEGAAAASPATEGGTSATGETQAAAAPEMSEEQLISTGEQVYTANCATCHQANGEGTAAYPALTQSNLLSTEDPTQAIQIVLHGRGQMPGFAGTLASEQIASVLSYERNSWGNNRAVVTVAQVEAVQDGGSAMAAGEAITATGEVTATATVTATAAATATAALTSTATGTATAPSGPLPTATITATTAITSSPPITGATTPTATNVTTPTANGAEATETEATPAPAGETPAASGTSAADDEQLISRGEEVYASNCAACHQLNGEGNAAYPALNQSEQLTAEDPTTSIEIVLHGRGQMPAFANTLASEEIAAVLSYERNAWDNNAAVVTAEQVEQVQAGGAAAEASQTITATATVTATGSPTATTNMTETATVTTTRAPTATAPMTATPTVTATTTVTAAPPAPTAETTALARTAGGTAPPPTWTPAPVVTRARAVGGPPPTWTPAPVVTQATAPPAANTPAATRTPQPQTASSDEQLISRGEEVYAINCAACHQLSGAGNAAYPALNESALLTTEDPSAAIAIVLHGRGQMPAFADLLSAAEIAAVLSYERNAWDNSAGVVSVEQVEQVQGGRAAAEANETVTATATLTTTATVTVTSSPTATTNMTASATVTGTATTTGTANAQNTATRAPTPQAQTTPSPTGETTTPAAAAVDSEQLISMGEEIYARNCASCHQASGEGNAAYPALNQSERLTAEDPTEAIEIVRHGRGMMPAFDNILSTEEIAAVLSYERNAWDNNAAVVTVDQVEQAE